MFISTALSGLTIVFRIIELPQKGDLWQLHFTEVAAFSQTREALRRLSSVSVESQVSLS